MDLTYVIGDSAVFNQKFTEFQQGIGHYAEVGFEAFGAIRESLDGTQTFFKGETSKLLPSDLAIAGTMTFDQAGAKAYIDAHRLDWEIEDLFI
jgi:hypothetical protein